MTDGSRSRSLCEHVTATVQYACPEEGAGRGKEDSHSILISDCKSRFDAKTRRCVTSTAQCARFEFSEETLSQEQYSEFHLSNNVGADERRPSVHLMILHIQRLGVGDRTVCGWEKLSVCERYIRERAPCLSISKGTDTLVYPLQPFGQCTDVHAQTYLRPAILHLHGDPMHALPKHLQRFTQDHFSPPDQ